MKAAGVQVEGYWPGLFAKLCEKRSVEDLITNVGSGKRLNRALTDAGKKFIYPCLRDDHTILTGGIV